VSALVLGAVIGVVIAVVIDSLLGPFSQSDDPSPAYSPPASMEDVVQRANAYDEGRRSQSEFQQQLWTLFAALMAGNAAKWSAIALFAAGDPTGRVSGIVGIVAGIIGAILGVAATQTSDAQEREVLGVSGLVFSFASMLFSGLSAIKTALPDVRLLAAVGLIFGMVYFGVSVHALYYV
jgi:hypothetical protein